MIEEIERWMDSVSEPGWFWFVKYLSGNDTLLTGAHQAGLYLSRPVAFELFPSIDAPSENNPRVSFPASIDSHQAQATPTAIWYNSRVRGDGTRNECRITGWGGKASPLLDPESTGSLCVFAFYRPSPNKDAEAARIWLCRSIDEEEFVFARVGPVEPGKGTYHSPEFGGAGIFESFGPIDMPCWIDAADIPPEWRREFPRAMEVVLFAISRVPRSRTEPPDRRLLRRRECEFEVFRSIEEAAVLDRVNEGFRTVDLFVAFANSVTNRRKSRSGKSLELHTKAILEEEGIAHSWGEVSENEKRPDFLFPSAEAYRDPAVPADQLRMLGVKTTVKDRWRQILNEADRIPEKHLLTLQQGVSVNQLEEMRFSGVTLVVPKKLHESYPESHRSWLWTMERFLAEVQ